MKELSTNQSAISLIIRATGICWNQMVCKGMAGSKRILLKIRLWTHNFMCLITYLCILIKSYKILENKGFIVMCSLYPFIWFHTMFPLPWLFIMVKARAGKTYNAIQQSVAIGILWTKKSSFHKQSIRLKELISAALLTFRWASIIIKSDDLKQMI